MRGKDHHPIKSTLPHPKRLPSLLWSILLPLSFRFDLFLPAKISQSQNSPKSTSFLKVNLLLWLTEEFEKTEFFLAMANLYVRAAPTTDLNRNTEWFTYPGVWTTYILILFFSWLVVLSVFGCSPGKAWTIIHLSHFIVCFSFFINHFFFVDEHSKICKNAIILVLGRRLIYYLITCVYEDCVSFLLLFWYLICKLMILWCLKFPRIWYIEILLSSAKFWVPKHATL